MVTYETYTKYSEVHDVEHKCMFTGVLILGQF